MGCSGDKARQTGVAWPLGGGLHRLDRQPFGVQDGTGFCVRGTRRQPPRVFPEMRFYPTHPTTRHYTLYGFEWYVCVCGAKEKRDRRPWLCLSRADREHGYALGPAGGGVPTDAMGGGFNASVAPARVAGLLVAVACSEAPTARCEEEKMRQEMSKKVRTRRFRGWVWTDDFVVSLVWMKLYEMVWLFKSNGFKSVPLLWELNFL